MLAGELVDAARVLDRLWNAPVVPQDWRVVKAMRREHNMDMYACHRGLPFLVSWMMGLNAAALFTSIFAVVLCAS